MLRKLLCALLLYCVRLVLDLFYCAHHSPLFLSSPLVCSFTPTAVVLRLVTHLLIDLLAYCLNYSLYYLLLFPLHSILHPSLAFKPSLYYSGVTLPHNYSIFLSHHSTTSLSTPLLSSPFLSSPFTPFPARGVVCCCDVLRALHRDGMVPVTRVSSAHDVVFTLCCVPFCPSFLHSAVHCFYDVL